MRSSARTRPFQRCSWGAAPVRRRLWNAADQHAGRLLLDHFSGTGSAMGSSLRRLLGRVAGILTAVDIESEAQRRALRAWGYGALTILMPAAPTATLRRFLAGRPNGCGCAHSTVEFGRPWWPWRLVDRFVHGIATRTAILGQPGLAAERLVRRYRGGRVLQRAPIAGGESVQPSARSGRRGLSVAAMRSAQHFAIDGGSDWSGLMTPKDAGV